MSRVVGIVGRLHGYHYSRRSNATTSTAAAIRRELRAPTPAPSLTVVGVDVGQFGDG